MAITRGSQKKGNTVPHSDHGMQYAAWALGKRIRDAGILGSMGTVGYCYDNLLDLRKWETRQRKEFRYRDAEPGRVRALPP